jgi:hypothetical protein
MTISWRKRRWARTQAKNRDAKAKSYPSATPLANQTEDKPQALARAMIGFVTASPIGTLAQP